VLRKTRIALRSLQGYESRKRPTNPVQKEGDPAQNVPRRPHPRKTRHKTVAFRGEPTLALRRRLNHPAERRTT